MASIDEGYEPIGADRSGTSGSEAESAPLFGAAVPRNKMSRAFLATLLGMLALGALAGLASGGPADPAASAAAVATTTAAEDGGLAISNLAAVAADPTVLASSKSKHKGKGKGKDDKKEKTWESTKAAPLSAPNAYTNVCADPNYTKVRVSTKAAAACEEWMWHRCELECRHAGSYWSLFAWLLTADCSLPRRSGDPQNRHGVDDGLSVCRSARGEEVRSTCLSMALTIAMLGGALGVCLAQPSAADHCPRACH